MEIEAKYTVLDPKTLAKLAALSHLAGFPIADVEVRRITDTYLDTPSQDLMAAGYACRRRRSRDQSAINLKSLGASDSTIHRREELTVAINESAMVEPALWPASPARDAVQGICAAQSRRADQKLVPLFELTQKRRIRHILDKGQEAIAELSLDRVVCSGGGRRQSFTELEIELLEPGNEAQLAHIVTALTEFPGVVPQPTSKFERGLAMAHRTSGVGGALALGNVRADDTVGEAARKLIRPLFLRMQLHESGTYLGDDPEELHDMRVMIRRMRTAFRMAKPYLDLTDLAAIRKGLRKTARILGSVRDMDVFRQKTEAYLAKSGVDRDELAPLIRVWDVEYARRRNEMLNYLNSKQYGRFKQASWARLDTHLPDRAVAASVRETVPPIVNKQLETLLAQGKLIELPDARLSAYHQLRIDVKHLRYTLRFFRNVLGPEVKGALKMLEVLQDTFGDLQDAAVAVKHLRAVIEHGTWETPLQAETRWHTWVGATLPVDTIPKGLAKYLSAREAEITAFITEAPEIWGRFHEAGTPRMVRDALAALQPWGPMRHRA